MKRVPATQTDGVGFKNVEAIGRTLPDVEVSTAYGQPALRLRGKLFACLTSQKSAEPNTLMVRMDFAHRDALIAEDPSTYYLKEHYSGYPCVLVRLSRVHLDALRELVTGAYKFVSAEIRQQSRRARPVKRKTSLPGG